MTARLKLRELESHLEDVDTFDKPKILLEQEPILRNSISAETFSDNCPSCNGHWLPCTLALSQKKSNARQADWFLLDPRKKKNK
jgi:hypothetical protein